MYEIRLLKVIELDLNYIKTYIDDVDSIIESDSLIEFKIEKIDKEFYEYLKEHNAQVKKYKYIGTVPSKIGAFISFVSYLEGMLIESALFLEININLGFIEIEGASMVDRILMYVTENELRLETNNKELLELKVHHPVTGKLLILKDFVSETGGDGWKAL